MNGIFCILLLCVGLAAALPRVPNLKFLNNADQFDSEVQLVREKRQFNAQGGGSRSQGFGLNANARAPVWQSQNQRHSVHGTTGYSQHVGGPYGSSKPDYRGGVEYSYKF